MKLVFFFNGSWLTGSGNTVSALSPSDPKGGNKFCLDYNIWLCHHHSCGFSTLLF